VLLNKIDLVTEADLKRVEGRIRSINKFAPIQRCQKSSVSVDSVLDIKGFDLKRTLEMDPEFLNTDGEHVHDNTVSSLSIMQPGEIDLDAVQDWIGDILQTKGADIFRMKGVLAIAHAKPKFVYQAVHMIFNGDFDEEELWEEDEPRESKLVFIGKNLDKKELEEGFAACAYTEESQKKKLEALRFKIGDTVECNVEGGWVSGEVTKLMFRDEEWSMPPGVVAPYQVKTVEGDMIYAPADNDRLVRSARNKKQKM